ncbi:MAG: AAA family ATPase [Candidatus Aenigmatarchaeota archaeon]|nr:AAA family ATPase [Candidatus Aenigmarchaeota archaeon]
MEEEKYYRKFNWSANPFVLKVDPKLFIGYEQQVRALCRHIEDMHKIALLTGATGAGKTTTLKWLEMNYPEAKYISKPPSNPEDLVNIFLEFFPLSFFERLFKRKPTLNSLPSYINKKMKSKLILLIDEAHEASRDVFEWLRVLTDQIDNISIVLAGLPIIEEKIKHELESLNQRITTRVTLTALSQTETGLLIQKRIESVGGKGTEPFTQAAIHEIYKRTGGFPREVLKFCDRLILSASEKQLDKIDAGDVINHKDVNFPSEQKILEPSVTYVDRPLPTQDINSLPSKQRKILEILSKQDWLSPSAIIEQLDMSNYKSRGHAVRSINNILKRLMIDGFVQRESHGKAFLYALTPKVKVILAKH